MSDMISSVLWYLACVSFGWNLVTHLWHRGKLLLTGTTTFNDYSRISYATYLWTFPVQLLWLVKLGGSDGVNRGWTFPLLVLTKGVIYFLYVQIMLFVARSRARRLFEKSAPNDMYTDKFYWEVQNQYRMLIEGRRE